MAELKDDITEERRILKEAGILDEKLLEKMDIYPGDRVRFRFYYPHSGFEEMLRHFLAFYTLYEGPTPVRDFQLFEGRREGERLPHRLRAAVVRFVFAAP